MTKIKNTKKGMAKKTLSMSLVVAMLATSNVPVWAAEFSDGSDAAVTSEAEAPAVDTTEEFSDNTEAAATAEAPVVEDGTDATVAQANDNYTVKTNLTLKAVDWNTGLTLEAPEGKTPEFSIENKDGVAVAWDKAEIYAGDSLYETVYADDDSNLISNLKGVTYGLDKYKINRNVTVKVYVDSEKDSVCEFSAVIQPRNINELEMGLSTGSKVYNGTVQSPSVDLGYYENVQIGTRPGRPGRPGRPIYQKQFVKVTDEVTIEYADVSEAKNVGTYDYKVVGKEAAGFTGTIDGRKFEITPATPDETNLSVTVSGSVAYGTNVKSLVTITDKYTNEVIPSYLYDVEVKDGKDVPGTYTASDIKKITLKEYANVNGKKVNNNFKAEDVTSLLSGNYAVTAFNLSELEKKYTIKVATKKINTNVETKDITFVDAAGKTYTYDQILPVNAVDLTTSNNTVPGTGTITITPKKGYEKNVTGTCSATFTVVNNVIGASDVAFPAGFDFKDGKAPATGKVSLTEKRADDYIYNALKSIVYNGTAQEPLKDVFSNLVLSNSVTTSDIKLVLGTDYDLTYSDNTDSEAVSGKKAKITFVFKGNYTGTFEYSFSIAKAQATVTGKDVEYVNGKNSYDVAVSVVTADKKEVPASEYTVTTTTKGYKVGDKAKGVVVFNNKNYDITNKGSNQNNGYAYLEDVVSNVIGKSIKNCTATIEGDYVYTGDSIIPKLVVKDGDTVLVEGKDYKVSSQNNINAGKALVTIEGMGNYSGSLTLEYEIKKADLANATVVSNKKNTNYDVNYTGLVVAPDIKTVKIGNVSLKAYDPISKTGDYVITYDEAVDAGTYNFTITALASSKNVEGEFKGTFKVKPVELTAGFAPKLSATYANIVSKGTVLGVSATGAYYTGKEITIDSFKTKYVLVDNKNNVLTEGKDYRLEYQNNVDAGKASVVAYGLGNHAVTDENGKDVAIASMSYYIEGKAVISNSWVQKISDVEYAGGLPVEPEVVIYDTNKNRLVQGIDYTVETTATEVGTYTQFNVIIKGKGAYTTTNNDNDALTFVKSSGWYPTYYNFSWKVTKKDLKNTTVSVDKNDNVTVVNGSVIVPTSEYDVKFSEDGKKVTVTAKANSKYYTGSKELEVNATKVGAPMISDVKVVGNKATVILSGEAEGASGYDYVISTDRDCITNKDYASVNKNQVQTSTTFKYVQKGVYYAYCHAWTRDENGKKVFGEWSNAYPFSVTAITPDAPVITNVKVSGSTIKVTYKAAANATGYDVVLGTSSKKENGETRPYHYGDHKVLNLKEGTVTATFKNVPAGTWVVGMHAFNRTSEDGSKVFSSWSNLKKATVK